LSNDSAILFDLGGTYLRAACMLPKAELANITRVRIRSFHDGLTSSAIWIEIVDRIIAYTTTSRKLVARDAPVAISFPGPIYEGGQIVNAPTVTGVDLQIPDVRAEISRRTQRNVYLLNDVSAAALYLAGRCTWERFIVVTISSGIGSKICYRNSGQLNLLDKGPYAGEIGHVTVDESDDAPVCDCGGKGHVGAIASGRGVELFARRRAASDSTSFSHSLCHLRFGATAKTLTNEDHFVPAIRAGDRWANDVLQEATQPLAKVLAVVTLAVGLQGILIIGGFAFGLGQIYLDLLHKLIRQRLDYSAIDFSSRMVEFGHMCEQACLLGAAEYARTAMHKKS